MKKITIGFLSNRGVKLKTVKSISEMIVHSKEHELEIAIAGEGYTIAENRSYLAGQAVRNGSHYLLMVDDDMTFPPDTLEKMLATGKQIVGVLSYSRMLPLKPTVVPVNEITDTLFECKEVGGGILLIDTTIFNAMPQPWFDFKTFPFGQISQGEDAFFCAKSREMGYTVWCEPTIKIFHIGDYLYG